MRSLRVALDQRISEFITYQAYTSLHVHAISKSCINLCMFLVKYVILFYDYAFILAPLPLYMYRHISLSKLHTPYVNMK